MFKSSLSLRGVGYGGGKQGENGIYGGEGAARIERGSTVPEEQRPYFLLAAEKYSLEEVGSGLMVALLAESSQLAGQTSPCSSVTGVTSRQVSGRSLPGGGIFERHTLEGLDEADGLVDGAADREVVDGDLAEGALRVDQEEAPEGDAGLLEEDAVVARDLHVLVGDELELEVRAEAALVAVGVGPREVRVLRVGRDGEDLGAELFKVGKTLVEGEDLGRADEGD